MTTSKETMNCEDYKAALAADPSATPAGGAEHVAACESCAAFKADMQSLDAKIARALAISVPELVLPELPDIDADNVTRLPTKSRHTFSIPIWLGIAATVVIAAFVGVRLIDLDPGTTPSALIEAANYLNTHLRGRTLSEARAESVADFLAQEGVSSGRIDTKGFGENQPVASNDSDNGRQKNRRVEVVIDADSLPAQPERKASLN